MKQFDYDKIMQPKTVVRCDTQEQREDILKVDSILKFQTHGVYFVGTPENLSHLYDGTWETIYLYKDVLLQEKEEFPAFNDKEKDQSIIKRQGDCITRMQKQYDELFRECEKLRTENIKLGKSVEYWKRSFHKEIEAKRSAS